MKTRIQLFTYPDENEVRLQTTSAMQLKAALFDLLYRGTIEAGDIGITMNAATIGASDKYEGNAEDLAANIDAVLGNEGYQVV